ncbi:hypothetical protein GCM10009676_40400 [Prauserella halophila]|uniref:GH16 domain-containing protein n=1 Tax=Prauserella halophila TaxID=185641 RepID=A0ABP4H4M8_9PSEU
MLAAAGTAAGLTPVVPGSAFGYSRATFGYSRPSASPDGADPPPGHRWAPHFEDQFGTIDRSLWYRYHNTYGWANQTEDYLRPENLRADGTLRVFTEREHYRDKDFTSGFLSTARRGPQGSPEPARDTFFPRAGFFEMRGKVQHAQGMLHACWLRHRAGASIAEVDLMEVFHCAEPGNTRQTLHLDGSKNTFDVSTHIEEPDAEPDWHTWGVGIIPESDDVRFRFYTDGVLVGEHLATEPKFWHDFAQPDLWDLSINTHTGGPWVGHPDDPPGYSRYDGGFCLSGGEPPNCDSTGLRSPTFPVIYEVDYVRVWSLASG